MDGKLFLGIAQFLINERTDEAAFRCAISRAYYACFLEARQIAFDNCERNARIKAHIKDPKDIGHKPLLRYLQDSSDVQVVNLGDDLASLQGNRIDADYCMTSICSSEDAGDSIEEATLFLEALSQSSPSNIGKAMAENINKLYP